MCMKKIIFLDFDDVLNTEYNQICTTGKLEHLN